MTKRYWFALAALIGYIIGVGMFGLPFLFMRAGLWPCLILIAVIGTVQYYIHLIYASVIADTPGYHRTPGYAKIYLGEKGKHFAFFASMIGNYGAVLAYIIVGGIFAHELFNPIFGGSLLFYTTALYVFMAGVVLFGIKAIARFELIFTLALLVIIVIITKIGAGYVDFTNYNPIDWKYALLPYGAILFAFDGGGAIPIVAEIVKKDKKQLKSAVAWGTFISIAMITFFALVVAGITGKATTPDGLVGLWNILDGKIIQISLVFGLLVIATSFFGVAQCIKEIFTWDYKVRPGLAFIFAVVLPYLLFLAGLNNFINVISFAGAISGGLTGISLILIFRKMEKKEKRTSFFKHKPGLIFLSLVFILFAAGILYEVLMFGRT
ncbi:MAG: aromatic amino acid transport family protein [Patescibacteria group bacterium]|jgi:amino acid permease